MYILDNQQTALILLIAFLGVILLLILIAVVKAIIKGIRQSKVAPEETDDDFQKDMFYQALGGLDNIKDITRDLGRITVTVNNPDTVNAEIISEFGAKGILIVGNDIKCNFGDRAESFYNMMKLDKE